MILRAAACPLLVLVGCSSWSEEEVGGLRHLWRDDHAPSGGSTRVDVHVEEGETNLLVTVQADPERSVIGALEGPGSASWAADTTSPRTATNAGFVNGVSVLNWPITDEDPALSAGRWAVAVGVVGDDLTYVGGDFRLDAWLSTDPDPDAGVVPVTFELADGLDQDPELAAALDAAVATWTDLYAAIGLTLDVEQEAWEGQAPGLPGVSDPAIWRDISAADPTRIHVVFREIIDELPEAYGLAGGIPGAIGATGNSGVLVSSTLAAGADGHYTAEETRILAETLAHETGHYLGLFHPVEIGWEHWDAVDDTPECGSEPDCTQELSANLMYPYPVCSATRCTPQAELTDGQGRVARRWTGLR